MMSISTIQLKKVKIYRRTRFPHARNPIYQKEIYIDCKYCKIGRKKKFRTLYQIYRHLLVNHPYDYGIKDYTMSLADKVIRGEEL